MRLPDPRVVVDRLQLQWLGMLQAALAATASWTVAADVLGHDSPIFAPLSAVIAMGAGYGNRLVRVVEIVAGVAIGILVADLIVQGIGTGIWQLGLVTLAAMVVAVALGAKPMVVTQAAISAMLVVTVQPPGSGLALPRFLDALVGGAVAVAVTALLAMDPVKAVKRASDSVFEELAAVLRDVAAALEARDAAAVVAALHRARALETREGIWRDAVEAGREIVRTAPPQRHARIELAGYEHAVAGMDLAIRNVRVLIRGALRAVELDEPVPAEIPAAMRHLADAVGELGSDLENPEAPDEARVLALLAAAEATEAHERAANLSVSVMAGQIRSTAVDLLRGLGEIPSEARAAIRAASVD
jgi:uncharacterized membrane protein YgaE (UPF0421/DUF939 family)